MKAYADKHRREVSYAVRDWVLLKSQPYRMRALAKHANEKLNPRFYGPFQVLDRVGPMAYQLALPPNYSCTQSFMLAGFRKQCCLLCNHKSYLQG